MTIDPLSPASFVNELGLAWKQLWIYPPGHPARAGSVERAYRALARLLGPTGLFALGVERDAFVCGQERNDSPSAQRLAGQLFGRNVAVVSFADGIDVAELERFLNLINPDPGQTRSSRFWEEMDALGCPHVTLQPVDYSGLELTDDLTEPEPAKKEAPPKPGDLWQEILEQLLAGRKLGAEGLSGAAATLAEVISVIEKLLEAALASGAIRGEVPLSEEQAAVRARATINSLAEQIAAVVARHLDLIGPEAFAAELLQIAHLLRALPAELRPPILDAVLRRVVALAEPADALGLLAASTSAAEVLASTRRLASRGLRLTDTVLQTLEALFLRTAPPGPAPATGADAVARLFALGDIEGPLPGGAGERFLLALPQRRDPLTAPLPELEKRQRSLGAAEREDALAETLLQLAFTATAGDRAAALANRLEALFRGLLRAGRLEAAEGIVAAVAAAGHSGRDEARQRRAGRLAEQLAGPGAMAALAELIGQLPAEERERPLRLVRALGDPAIAQLLDQLSAEQDLTRRRHLFDFLVGLGPALTPHAVRLLDDPRWFVVRNMLALLCETGDRSQAAAIRNAALHADARVRLEAVRALAALDPQLPAALVDRLLADPDSRVAEFAARTLAARTRHGRDTLVALLRRRDLFGRQRARRLQALRTLGALGDPEVLPLLRRSFRGGLFGVSVEERRVAYAALAGYPPAARRPWLEQGRRSGDTEIRRTCEQLLATSEEVSS
ncbi:MAG: HEAT repeat domain-containing protein [Acidobacteria bacterium]|nr:HEAT repeat domain-containing protein [Thermoanaerobaculia bacterium]NLN11555.1 HEAT repeat domain-containing protein [Acidobacteriota bacterium]MBP7812824.1 HEAT repeat domain-containing protein [Thermoanaerobaculia bacterium]MBP8845436.1 HEAT repeat domain-containing protein [Thermoanaerobaculia bacterium]HPA96538.1 hypothetical protein [Thermoanaerobaculia bacterium]